MPLFLAKLKGSIYYFSLHTLARRFKCRKYYIETLSRRIEKKLPYSFLFFQSL
ncbi:Uncharacterized protein NEOC65_002149 [Neochlamydia sp. AcF65]|nr:Uncharacterized protein [Neochlamydia sp. AcF65]MBS4170729.1 Uncharacterized protein [Neochlamydia sp. AcF95]